MTTPSFSVVVVARNEARTLPVLAGSLGPFLSAGGEFIVLDTGSDDDTVRVARDAGARVETVGTQCHSMLSDAQAAAIGARFARHGEGPLVQAGQVLFDFGRAREHASQLASHDFVWHIDASDVVEALDLDFLDASVRCGEANSFDYVLRVGSASLRIVRFFDRRLYRWRGRVHEVPFASGAAMTGRRVSCDERQLSLRHLRGEKTRNYLAGLALDVLDDPNTPRWRYYLGRELSYGRWFRSAIGVLRTHARTPDAWVVERGASLSLMGTCFEALGRPRAAATCYSQAARLDPSRREPLLKLALLRQGRGDFQGSVVAAAAALAIPRSGPFIELEDHYTTDPHAMLYWGLFWLGRRDEARGHWDICRRLAPDNEKFREDGRLFADRSQGYPAPALTPVPPVGPVTPDCA